MTGRRLRLGVLISGRGSNLQSLIDACAGADFPAEIALVVSNVAGAEGLARAGAAGLPCAVVGHRDYPDRESFEAEITRRMETAGVELICMAGFMRVVTAGFVTHWFDRLINIHPALLPAYPGLRTHARALADGVRFSGCTVHLVRPDLDCGPIIIQAAVPVLDGDTPETLADRVLESEHRIYPQAVRLLAEGRVTVEGPRVRITGAQRPCPSVINPPPG